MLTPLLVSLALPVLGLLFVAIAGGYFIRKGSYKPTIELLEKLVNTYKETVAVGQQELEAAKQQNALLTASVARAGEELRAERARSVKQDRAMADMALEIHTLQARITELEAQLHTLQNRQTRVRRAAAQRPRATPTP